MKKHVKGLWIGIAVVIAITLLSTFFISCTKESEPLLSVSAENIQSALDWHEEKLFENNEFDGIAVSEHKMIGSKQLEHYTNFTKSGSIYVHELVYELKTDDPRALLDNKIKAEQIEPGSWITDFAAHRVLVLFERDGVCYNLLNWDRMLGRENLAQVQYHWDNMDYGGSNSSNKDILESRIIKEIFQNPKNIPGLKISDTMTSDGVLRKLIRDIDLFVRPDYTVDFDRSRVYGFTYDYGIDAIYFRADLTSKTGEKIVENMGFSLFLNEGFSIGEKELNFLQDAVKTN